MKYHVPTKMLVIVLRNLMRFFTKKSFCHQGFFAVKRRAVFILGAMWIALVRGWRSDCVVGSMETRFQWRKAHKPYAKCEAFHIAPRLFFMFLFFIPLTIRQQSIIYPHKFSTEPLLYVWSYGRWLENGAKIPKCRYWAFVSKLVILHSVKYENAYGYWQQIYGYR